MSNKLAAINNGRKELEDVHARRSELNQKVVDVVFEYIDRMNDVCSVFDPADKILDQFTSEVMPIIDDLIAR